MRRIAPFFCLLLPVVLLAAQPIASGAAPLFDAGMGVRQSSVTPPAPATFSRSNSQVAYQRAASQPGKPTLGIKIRQVKSHTGILVQVPVEKKIQPVSIRKISTDLSPKAKVIHNAKKAGVWQTRPDPVDHTRPSTFGTITAGWKMILYLLPMLALIWLALKGLRRIYPGAMIAGTKMQRPIPEANFSRGVLKHGFAGWKFGAFKRKETGNIRVIESLPIGAIGLYLVEVRGRLLLLGSSNGGLTVLTEFSDEEEAQSHFDEALKQATQTAVEEPPVTGVRSYDARAIATHLSELVISTKNAVVNEPSTHSGHNHRSFTDA